MKQGGWTEAESYRDLIKDKEVAVSLEQQSRINSATNHSSNRSRDLCATPNRTAKCRSRKAARRVTRPEGRLRRRDRLVSICGRPNQRSDPGLVRKVTDLKMKRSNDQIREHEKYLAEHARTIGEFRRESAALASGAKKSGQKFLIEDARKRLERNPTDLQLRFELGEH